MSRRCTIALTVCSVLTAPLFAGEGATPVWEPTVITAPGSYVLTRDITSSVPKTIEIQATDVSLDLNGFTVANTAGQAIRLQNADRAAIKNGTVKDGRVYVYSSQDVLVTGLTLVDPGVDGIYFNDSSGQIVDNMVTYSVSGKGIYVLGSPGMGVRVIGNKLVGYGDGGPGIYIQSPGCQVTGNVVRDFFNGIEIQADGIQVSQNVVVSCDRGIYVTGAYTQITNNLSSESQIGMMITGDYGHIEGNTVSGNSIYGIWLMGTSEMNVYRRNTARANFVDFEDAGTGNTSHGDNYMPSQM